MSLETVGPLGDTTNHPLVGIVMLAVIFTTTEDITTTMTTVEIIMAFVVVVEDTILAFRMEVLSILQPPTDKVNRLTRILSNPNQ
jgi:hypothetical protein